MISVGSANAAVLRFLEARARQYNFPPQAIEIQPASMPKPYGTHPDLVERLWEGLTKRLPVDCHWVVHGTPVLVRPSSGVIFGMAFGSSTYALRLPLEVRNRALAAGAKRFYRYRANAAAKVEALTVDLAEVGDDWVFGAWLPGEEEWCLAAFQAAAGGDADGAPGSSSPSDALRAVARAHATKIVSGEMKAYEGARAIWTDVFYHLAPDDHFVDGFVYWADQADDAESAERRQACESAIVALAYRLLHDEGAAIHHATRHEAITLFDFAALRWLEPWQPAAAGLEEELKREVGPGHPLFGQKAVSVGRRTDTDDVLFLLPDHASPLAVVHLAWNGRHDPGPGGPPTTFYSSVDQWVEECMRVDHAGRGSPNG